FRSLTSFLQKQGFRINPEKTSLPKDGEPLVVLGYQAQNNIWTIPDDKLKQIKGEDFQGDWNRAYRWISRIAYYDLLTTPFIRAAVNKYKSTLVKQKSISPTIRN